jgi:hypothetical protein
MGKLGFDEIKMYGIVDGSVFNGSYVQCDGIVEIVKFQISQT